LQETRALSFTDNYTSAGALLRCRRDGVFEFLRPDDYGDLSFARLRSINQEALATWEDVNITVPTWGSGS
jgi:hypothetical protein